MIDSKLKIKKKSRVTKELLYCTLSAILCLIGAFVILKLFNMDWNVPFSYTGDVFGSLTAAQNFIAGNGRFLYPSMGAPGIVTIAGFPDICNTSYLGMWFLSLFINDAGLLVNVFYILTYPCIAAAATLALRGLKISPKFSIAGGVLYTFLPYHLYRGESHLFLATYAIIPLICMVILWTISNQLEINLSGSSKKTLIKIVNNKKLVFSIFIAILLGADNLYYIFFGALGMCFAIIYNYIENRSIKKLIGPLIVLSMIVTVTLLNLIPYILTLIEGMQSSISGSRNIRDVEIYGLKFIELVLPVNSHRIPFLAKIKDFYNHNIAYNLNESVGSTLGALLSMGFIISIFISMRGKKENTVEGKTIRYSGILNVFILILGSIGGIASIIAFIVPQIRCYNRLSIFIAFYSLVIICSYGQKIKFTKRYNQGVCVMILTILGILDLTSKTNTPLNFGNIEQYYEHKQLIKEVETITPKGSMIFQLPFVPSSYHTSFENMGPYEQFFPFIHSTNLRWSYRAQQNSPAERWQKKVSNLPVKEMLKNLAVVGFSGVYIDSAGYSMQQYQEVTEELRKITGVTPIYSRSGRMEYYYLGEYMKNIYKDLTEDERTKYSNWKNSGYIVEESIKEMNVLNKFENTLTGWSYLETWGVWSEGDTVNLEFNMKNIGENSKVNLDIQAIGEPTKFIVFINDYKLGDYELIGSTILTVDLDEEIIFKEGELYPVNIKFEIQNPQIPSDKDGRLLGIGLKSYTICY